MDQESIPPQPEPVIPPSIPPIKRFNPILILAAIILLVVIGVGGLILGKSLSSPKQTVVPMPSVFPTSTPDETANWETYTNTEYGFSLKYPDQLIFEEMNNSLSWSPLLNNTFTVIFNDKEDDPVKKNIMNRDTIMVRIFNKKVPISDIVNSYFPALSNNWTNINVGSLQGKITDVPEDNSIKAKVAKVAYIINGNYVYYFHISTFLDDNSILEPTFYQILSTFKFASP